MLRVRRSSGLEMLGLEPMLEVSEVQQCGAGPQKIRKRIGDGWMVQDKTEAHQVEM